MTARNRVLKFRVIRAIRVRQLNRETLTICFQITNKKSRLILSDKPKISRLFCIGKKSNYSPLFWRALKKSPFFITKTENAYDL